MKIIRDAVIIGVLSAIIAVAFNGLRAGGLPLVPEEDWGDKLLVPCPVESVEVVMVPPEDPRISDTRSLVIDARTPEEYAAWHLDRAMSIPNDFLGIPDEVFEKVLGTGARHVVVYGDGSELDPGCDLAGFLMSKGVRNVVCVQGGAPALGATASKPEGGTP